MLAKNRVTEVAVFDDIMSIVTEVKHSLDKHFKWYILCPPQAPCSPPKLSIPFNSTDPLVPAEYFRAEQIVINTNAILNCTPVITTKYISTSHLCYVFTVFWCWWKKKTFDNLTVFYISKTVRQTTDRTDIFLIVNLLLRKTWSIFLSDFNVTSGEETLTPRVSI